VTDSNGILSFESRATRHIIGRVSRGKKLREAFRDLVDAHDLRVAWVSAIGAFEWIELTEYTQSHRRYEAAHRFERCELLSMQGNLSQRGGQPFWHFHATISLREDGHDATYGGHVVDGVVFALELRIECFDELELRREHDAATGLELWAGAEGAQSGRDEALSAEEAGSSITWAMAAEASARARPTVVGEHRPGKGDWIEHAAFGLCRIEGLSGEGVCIIKLPGGRRKKIKIDAMQVLPPRDEDGRKVFAVRPKPRA
jgi:predicted DNA-binding protein with PD1-like motif